MLINLKMRSSSIFKKKTPPEEVELTEEDEKALKFNWHCKKGITGDIRKLNEEFNVARNLKPLKVMITGPPAAGKSYYASYLNKNYDIPRITIKEIADKALKMAETEDEEGPAADIKAKIDAAKDDAIAKIGEEAEARGEEAPEIDKDTFQIPVPDDILYELVKQRLTENDARNRGYVLDGYPRTHYDAENIFLKEIVKYDEEGQVIEREPEELEEG